MENIRTHVLIEGLTQGVYFRASTQKEAVARGVSGWVRNNPDGTVEAVFEGSKKAVEGLLKWCESGPSEANVTEVNYNYEEVTGEFTDFKIYTDSYSF